MSCVELANCFQHGSALQLNLDHTGSWWLSITVHCIALICVKKPSCQLFHLCLVIWVRWWHQCCRNLIVQWFTLHVHKHTGHFISSCDTSRCFDLEPSQCAFSLRFYKMASLPVGCVLEKAKPAPSGESQLYRTDLWCLSWPCRATLRSKSEFKISSDRFQVEVRAGSANMKRFSRFISDR